MPSANKGSIPNTIRSELLFGANRSSKPETSYLKGYTSQLIATRQNVTGVSCSKPFERCLDRPIQKQYSSLDPSIQLSKIQ
jgi:hypothetical protein